jgi:hypothetical protein
MIAPADERTEVARIPSSRVNRRDHGAPVSSPASRALAWQLAVMREMIATLDTLTLAGRQHLMGKIVSIIRNHVESLRDDFGRRNRKAAVEVLERLTREADCPVADVRAFSRGAESLVALLAIFT